MSDSLTDKIEKLKDEHAAEKHSELATHHDNRALAAAHFILGRIKQNDHLSHAISSNLDAQTIRALERFQREKQHEVLGFDTFDQFLNESEFSPMTKRQYYDRLALVRGHGDEIYDLLTAVGISVRSQKMLGKGELSIKNDTLYIGDREVEVANTGIIKDVLNDLFDEKRQLQTDIAKRESRIEKLEAQVSTGTDEYDELRRSFDALNDGDPHDRAYSKAANAIIRLMDAAETLPEAERKERGRSVVKQLHNLVIDLRSAYGINTALVDSPNSPDSPDSLDSTPDFEAKLAAAIAEDDNLDQEDLD